MQHIKHEQKLYENTTRPTNINFVLRSDLKGKSELLKQVSLELRCHNSKVWWSYDSVIVCVKIWYLSTSVLSCRFSCCSNRFFWISWFSSSFSFWPCPSCSSHFSFCWSKIQYLQRHRQTDTDTYFYLIVSVITSWASHMDIFSKFSYTQNIDL